MVTPSTVQCKKQSLQTSQLEDLIQGNRCLHNFGRAVYMEVGRLSQDLGSVLPPRPEAAVATETPATSGGDTAAACTNI